MEKTNLKPPQKIMQIMHARWLVESLKTAVRFDIFSRLAHKAKGAAALAEEIKADSRGTELLLNALTAAEFLSRNSDGKYELTEVSRSYLVKESSLYFGSYIEDEKVGSSWARLSEAVSSGKPLETVNQCLKAEEFFPSLAASIFPMNYGTAHMVAAALGAEKLAGGARVLDVASGSGVWSLPFAERNKGVKVDALDFPAVLAVTKRFAEKHGVSDQYSYIAGNWRDCRLDEEAYDVVCLGHILHSEGKRRSLELLKQSHSCLKKGGKLIIAEMISDDERRGSLFPQLFALNMFLLTEEGCVFTESELFQMCSEAGFSQASRLQLDHWGSESPVIIACK